MSSMSFKMAPMNANKGNSPHEVVKAVPDSTLAELSQKDSTLQEEQMPLADETALLHKLISITGSTVPPEEILHSLLETLSLATNCQAALLFDYQQEQECLTLYSASELSHNHLRKNSIPTGEGFVGWVALTRQMLLLPQDAMQDARFQIDPELAEEPLQAIMALPLENRESQLLGVLALYFTTSCNFTTRLQTFIKLAGTLVAGILENIHLNKHLQQQETILETLALSGQTISSSLQLTEMLRLLATRTMQCMKAGMCAILLTDPESGQISKQIVAPQYEEQSATGLIRIGELNNLPSDKRFQALLSQPLVAGTEQLGQINCYSITPRRFTEGEQRLLKTIASQIALAIKNSQLRALLTRENLVHDFFQELRERSEGNEEQLRQQATFLGCELGKPHVVVMIEIAYPNEYTENALRNQAEESLLQRYKRLASLLQRRIQEQYPGSLIHEQENILTCLLYLSKDPTAARLRNWLRDLSKQISNEYSILLSIGLGNVCQGLKEYKNGFAEASEALQMGSNLNPEGGITHFNDLGVYRYLYKIARMDGLRDIYQDQVARIALYDNRKGTDLLTTLEIFLECAGNLTRTSNRLFVHRNTLIQRLERLQSLCDIDLQDRSNWLTLQVAMKVYKLRAALTQP